jgi:D-glycero-D-manno-heptose 1,7-bisphosphate phosphatase
MQKLVFLDRDGVINHDSDDFIKSPEEWHAIDGSMEAISSLCKAGFVVAIVTNQSGIGRKLYDLATLTKIHEKMHTQITNQGGKISALAFCPHLPTDDCNCRKPKTGMIDDIKNQLGISEVSKSYFVGDTIKDIETAKNIQAIPILVKTGKGERTLASLKKDNIDVDFFVVDDLISASKIILQNITYAK